MIKERLSMIFTWDELCRVQIREAENDSVAMIIADVHGMKCFEAKRFINNIINAVRITFQLIVIHGYNHGTAIKDMLAYNFKNEHVCSQWQDQYNRGITRMYVAA